MRPRNLFIILAIAFAVLYLAPLGLRPLISPDETRYAEAAREMIETNNYVAPYLNGARYFEKPVMGYWFFAGSMKLLGETAFAVRLPVVISMLLCALALFIFTTRFLKEERHAFAVAPVLFLSMPLVFILGTTAILDMPFTLFVTLTMVFFFEADRAEKWWKKILFLILCGLAAGAAFLIKGFLAFALPAVSAVAYLIWEKRWKEIFIVPWIPLIAAVAVIMPWAVRVYQAEPDFWRYFIVVEHLQRFLPGAEAQHPRPIFFFIPIIIGGAAQCMLLLPSVKEYGHRADLNNTTIRYLICWVVMPFAFLSLSRGKLPTYILPCFPPLAVLFSIIVSRGMSPLNKGFFCANIKYVSMFLAFVTACATAVITLNPFIETPIGCFYLEEEAWKWMIAVTCAFFVVFLFISAWTEKHAALKTAYFFIACTPVCFCSFFAIPNRLIESKCPTEQIEAAMEKITPDTVIVSHRLPFQNVCWTLKRSDVILMTDSEIDYGLSYPEDKHRRIGLPDLKKLVKENEKKGGVLLVMPTDKFEEAVDEGRIPLAMEKWRKPSMSSFGYTMVLF